LSIRDQRREERRHGRGGGRRRAVHHLFDGELAREIAVGEVDLGAIHTQAPVEVRRLERAVHAQRARVRGDVDVGKRRSLQRVELIGCQPKIERRRRLR
jgi:hypothetical protein